MRLWWRRSGGWWSSDSTDPIVATRIHIPGPAWLVTDGQRAWVETDAYSVDNQEG